MFNSYLCHVMHLSVEVKDFSCLDRAGKGINDAELQNYAASEKKALFYSDGYTK